MKKFLFTCLAALALVACEKDPSDAAFKVGMNKVEGSGTLYAVELENRALAKFTVTEIKMSEDMKSLLEIYGVGYEMISSPGPDVRTPEGLRFSFDLTEKTGNYYLPEEDMLIIRAQPELKIEGDRISFKWTLMAVTGAPRLLEFEAKLK